jgi:cell division transport system permease protein
VTRWLRAHRDALAHTLRQFGRRPVTTVLSLAVITIGLLFPVAGYVLVANVRAVVERAGSDPQITVFLAADATAADRGEIERRLRADARVQEFRFVGKEAALADLQARTGSADLLAGLSGNPLPDAFLVVPKVRTSGEQSAMAATIRGWPKIADVDIDAAWTDRLRLLASTAEWTVAGMAVVLGFAMLAISFNTIRLQVLTRGEESAVLALFGATRAYIRRPFLYFGALQGLIAAALAWAVAALAVWWLEPRVGALIEAYGLSGRLGGLTLRDGVVLLALSAGVGLTGAWLGSTER